MRKDVALGIVFWIMCIIILAIASYYYSSFSWARPYFTLENEILAGLVLFPVCIFLSRVYEAYKGEPRHYRSYRQEYRPHRERPNIKETSSDYESSFSEDEEDAHQRGYDEERGRQDAREDYYEEKRQEREYRRRQKEAQDNFENLFLPPRNSSSSPEDYYLGKPKKKKDSFFW